MLKPALLLIPIALTACGKDKSNKPRSSLGACVYTDKLTNRPTICFENSTQAECKELGPELSFRYVDDKTCASQGLDKICPQQPGGPEILSYARFASCAKPVSGKLEHAKHAVTLFEHAVAIIDSGGGDCTAIGQRLIPVRKELWTLTQEHPPMLKSLTKEESRSLGAVAAFNTLVAKLEPCASNLEVAALANAAGKAL